MKKFTYYILLSMTVLLLFGCKKENTYDGGGVIKDYEEDGSTGTPSPTEEVEQEVTLIPEDTNHECQMISNLSGLSVSEEV